MKTFPYWRTAGQAMRWARIQGNAKVTRYAFDDHENAGEDPALDHHWQSGDYKVTVARELNTGRALLKVTHCDATKVRALDLDAGHMLNILVGIGVLPDCFYVPTLPPGAYPSIEVPTELHSVFVAAVKAARHVQALEIRRLHRRVQHLGNERDRAQQASRQLAVMLLDQAMKSIPAAPGQANTVERDALIALLNWARTMPAGASREHDELLDAANALETCIVFGTDRVDTEVAAAYRARFGDAEAKRDYARGGVVNRPPGPVGHTCVSLCCDCPPSQLGWPTRHLFGDESAVSECCGRTRLEMPNGDWFTSNPDMTTCQGKPGAVWP